MTEHEAREIFETTYPWMFDSKFMLADRLRSEGCEVKARVIYQQIADTYPGAAFAKYRDRAASALRHAELSRRGISNALPLLWLRREPKFLRRVQALEGIGLIVRIVIEGGHTSLAKTAAPLEVKAVVTDPQVELAVRSSHKLGAPTYKFRTSPEELELSTARSISGKVFGSKLKDKCPPLRARQNLLDGLLAGRSRLGGARYEDEE